MREPETPNTAAYRDHRSQTENGPRIYVACLAAYNNGRLHGRWIDAGQDVEEIQTEITEMLAASPIQLAEEWAIHDYEGFEGASLGEFSSIQWVAFWPLSLRITASLVANCYSISAVISTT